MSTRYTVIVAVLNAATTIQRCLDSITRQGPDIEIIVIDGGSSDGTAEIVEANGPRLARWESTADRGIYHAWNKALESAHGEWVHFLGADDQYASPSVLSEAAARLAAVDPSVFVAYGQVQLVDASGRRVGMAGDPWAAIRDDFRRSMTIPHQAVFHRRSLFEQRGRFDEGYRICGDYELLLRELRDHEPAFLNLVVADVGGAGLSSRPESERLMRREFHRARLANGLTRTPEWLAPSVIRIEIRDWLARTFGPRVARVGVRAYRWAAGLFGARGR